MPVAVEQSVIHWQAASKAVLAAVEKADTLGVQINTAVVDTGGNLIAFLRMPEAPLHSISIAIDKAYTAAGFRLATSQWHELFEQFSDEVVEGLRQRPRLVTFGGGVPLWHQEKLIGAIGVSGASEEQDQDCANAALAALAEFNEQGAT